ncbi:hypothetical protein CAPTEDRAFT_137742, partial [Capitella teleta]
EVAVVPWALYSPDLKPIEHLWDVLGRTTMMRRHPHPIRQKWLAIPQETIRSLIRSMRRRCTACIEAHGGHTSY